MANLMSCTSGALVKRAVVNLLASIAVLSPSAFCYAQEGNFDPTFGNGGGEVVSVSVLGQSDSVARLILRPAGKLLMGGTCVYADPIVQGHYENTFCLTQLLAGGSYDGNFGPGGVGYVQLNRFSGWPSNTVLFDMMVLHDGRIALLGETFDDNTAEQVFLLGILRADGTALDSTVGGGSGYFKSSFGGLPGTPSSFIQQSDDKILVAGKATGINGNDDFAVARVLGDVSGLDTSFGSAGAQTVAFDLGGPGGNNNDACGAVRLQSDGKIVMAGYAPTSTSAATSSGPEIAITRLNTNGTRDLTFGTNGDGRVHYTAGEDLAVAFDAQIDRSDRIVVGGEVAMSGATSGEWVVDRLSRNGEHDATFNQGHAQLISQPPGNGGYVRRLTLTNDGIFAIGVTPRTAGSSATYFAVAHINADGSMDSRFGNGGRSYGSFVSTNDVDTDGADVIVGNGGVMVAGTQGLSGMDGTSSKFAIGRLKYDQIFSYGFE